MEEATLALAPNIVGNTNKKVNTVKPVYNDHRMGHFSAFWSSSRWPTAT